MSIAKRFIITSGVLLLLSSALAVVAIVGLNRIGSDVHSLATDSTPGIVYATATRADVLSLRGDYFNHILETNPDAIHQVELAIAADNTRLADDMKGYNDQINDDVDRANFDKIIAAVATVQRGWEKVLPVSRESKNVEAFQIYNTEITASMDSLGVQLVNLVDVNKKISDDFLASATSTVQTSWWITLALGIVSLVLGIGISWFMIRALNKELGSAVEELSEGAVQIASAASQVASSSQTLAQGSSHQAASLEETSSTTEQINAMAEKNTDNSGVMTRMVSESQSEFVTTNRQLGEMVTAMNEINNSSGKISKIIKVIDEIAFQTNILALNAAVEAARAGEAGMGFAVVADEVRNLAQRCAQAAKDTSELIEDSIEKSGSGKVKVSQVETAIRKITEEFEKIKTLVDEVGCGSKEQMDGIGLVRRAISSMEQVSQSTAASAEEGAAAAEQLNAQSEALKAVVGRLNQMAGRGSLAAF
jgi:methyl-accepting chemotaxis protein/methyl-accepting chemotaxis protein-1 (serine sensor receptor)